VLIASFCLSLPPLSREATAARGVEGRSYYLILLDLMGTQLQPFTCIFANDGTLTVNMEGKTFENASGTFVNMGKTFYGSWEATEKLDEKGSRKKSYSLLFLGTSSEKNIGGIIYSTIMDDNSANESQDENTDGVSSSTSAIVPFLGIVVDVDIEGGTITGKVTDAETGNPVILSQVQIDPGGYTTKTTVTGAYTLSYVEPGTYTVTASALGYESASQDEIEVLVDESVTVDFSLNQDI
jgi:hypothetical protein